MLHCCPNARHRIRSSRVFAICLVACTATECATAQHRIGGSCSVNANSDRSNECGAVFGRSGEAAAEGGGILRIEDSNGNLRNVSAEFRAEAYIAGNAEALRVYAQATANQYPRSLAPRATASASMTVTDTVSWMHTPTPMQLFPELEVFVGLTGNVSRSALPSYTRVSGLSAGLTASITSPDGSGRATLENTPDGPGGILVASIWLRPSSAHCTLNEHCIVTASFTKSLSAQATAVLGDAKADGSSTFRITKILDADGNTPESQGIELVFASGRTSPNLVPEPAGAVTAVLSGLAVASPRARRRPC